MPSDNSGRRLLGEPFLHSIQWSIQWLSASATCPYWKPFSDKLLAPGESDSGLPYFIAHSKTRHTIQTQCFVLTNILYTQLCIRRQISLDDAPSLHKIKVTLHSTRLNAFTYFCWFKWSLYAPTKSQKFKTFCTILSHH